MTTGTQPNLEEMSVNALHRFCKDNAIPGHWSGNLNSREKLIAYIRKYFELSQAEQAIEPSPDLTPGAEAVEENTAEQPGGENHANTPQVKSWGFEEVVRKLAANESPLPTSDSWVDELITDIRKNHYTSTYQAPEAWLDAHGFRSHFSDNLSQPAARWGRWAMWEAFTTHAKTRYLQVVHLSSNKCWHVFWQGHWHSFRDAARFLTNVLAALEPVIVPDASYCEVAMPAQVLKPPIKPRTPKLMLCLLGALLVGQLVSDCDHRGSECRRWVEVPV